MTRGIAHEMEVRTDSTARVLADRYEVGELLGAGGMAHVYRGRDRILERPVAIKVLDASLAADDRFLRSFVSEARAAAGLIHPNVVTVFDTGVDADQHFIVMELVEGTTLQQLLFQEHRLQPERARRIAIDVARALTVAHGRGLVHRDVKPGNVLVGAEGRPRVADFGIARPADQPDDTRTIFGTAAYLSPEQARGRPTTPASDVYSLGCVLYEMLTGRRPFTGDNPVAVAVKHLRHTPPAVEAVSPDVPPALASVVRRAMQKDPQRRFPDAGAMLAALEGAATVRGLPEQRRPRRLRWAAALVLGVVAVLAPAILGFGAGPSEPQGRVSAGEGRRAAEVEVPSVVGMSQEKAGRTLRRAGLVPIFRGAPLGDETPHVVATQDPPPGSPLVEGSFVTLELVPADTGGEQAPPPETEVPDEGSPSARGGERPRSDGDRGEPAPSPPPSPSPSPTPSPTPSPIPEA